MVLLPKNSTSWFETQDHYEKGAVEPTAEEFLKTIDCYVMGSRTYELALNLSKSYGWAYGDTPTIVVTQRELPINRPNVQLYKGDLSSLVNQLLKPNFKNVWVVGGAKLVSDFIRSKLADEVRQSITPIILGEGTPFYNLIEEQALHLKEVTPYKSGMVELCYELRK